MAFQPLAGPTGNDGNLVYTRLVFDNDTGTVVDGELDLSAPPTTTWPPNNTNPAQSDVYDFANDTFIENPVLGQAHIWRVTLTYTKSKNKGIGLGVRLRNPNSTFTAEQVQSLPVDGTQGNVSFLIITIADAASLPPPLGTGNGYIFEVGADADITEVVVDNVTRISLQQ